MSSPRVCPPNPDGGTSDPLSGCVEVSNDPCSPRSPSRLFASGPTRPPCLVGRPTSTTEGASDFGRGYNGFSYSRTDCRLFYVEANESSDTIPRSGILHDVSSRSNQCENATHRCPPRGRGVIGKNRTRLLWWRGSGRAATFHHGNSSSIFLLCASK